MAFIADADVAAVLTSWGSQAGSVGSGQLAMSLIESYVGYRIESSQSTDETVDFRFDQTSFGSEMPFLDGPWSAITSVSILAKMSDTPTSEDEIESSGYFRDYMRFKTARTIIGISLRIPRAVEGLRIVGRPGAFAYGSVPSELKTAGIQMAAAYLDNQQGIGAVASAVGEIKQGALAMKGPNISVVAKEGGFNPRGLNAVNMAQMLANDFKIYRIS